MSGAPGFGILGCELSRDTRQDAAPEDLRTVISAVAGRGGPGPLGVRGATASCLPVDRSADNRGAGAAAATSLDSSSTLREAL